jgi:benzoate/toluate 1,2-dioxygenase beta subunit
MTTATDALQAASDLLYREALYLDERRWDEWLALFDEQAEFWVPAWRNETEPTEDPRREVSLIYMTTRAELRERVGRVRSGKSIASVPPPRTAHAVSNIVVEPAEAADRMTIRSVWTTHVFNVKRREQLVFFTRCEHHLLQTEGAWRIRRRKALLLNDYLPTMLDFYSI